jgi:hypothetical protein
MSGGVNITGAVTNRHVARITGTYSVEVTNLTGNCRTNSAAVQVTVQNAPSAPLITYTGTTTICQNDSVLLSVSNTPGYQYQWKLNGGAVGTNSNLHAARNNGNYNLTVSNSNGCSVNSANQIPVTVNSLPVVGNISQAGNDTRFCKGENITLSVPQNTNYTYSWKRGNSILGLYTNTIMAAESGEYTVEVSTLPGCKLTAAPLNIEVVETPAKPSVDYGSYKKDTCLGEAPLKLSVKDFVQEYTYKWYRNGTPVGNSAFIETRDGGNYYIEAYYDICKSDTVSFTIQLQNPVPKPEIIARGPTVWYLTTVSNPAYTYKWYYEGNILAGVTGSTYVAGQKMGLYRVAVSDATKCYSFSDPVRIPTGIVGTEDIDPFGGTRIYPNPSTGVFTIDMNNNVIGELIIDIYTQNGTKAFNIRFEKTGEHFSTQIDLSGRSKGMYFINLSIDAFKAVRKVVVE